MAAPKRFNPSLPVAMACTAVLAACGGTTGQSASGSPSSSAAAGGSTACNAVQQQNPSVVGKSLIVASDPSSPGYETIDVSSNLNPGHLVGFDADLLHALAQCAGFQYSYLTEAFGSLIVSLQAGRAQMVMSTLYATPARAKVVNFVAYEGVVDGALLRKGNPKNLNSITDICGTTIAQETGAAEVGVAQAQSTACVAAGKPSVNVLLFATQDQVFNAVQQGRADLTMTDVPVVTKVAQQFASTLQIGFDTKLPYTIAMAFQKSETPLMNALFDALKVEQSNGTETTLLKKWTLAPESLAPAQEITS
jgi:polar amino acid transport system substrate-binding protein